jgi:hypothetical protein
MKRKIWFLISVVSLTLISVNESCTPKIGCPGENTSLKMDEDGNLPTRKGKSQLFDKKMTNRAKKH